MNSAVMVEPATRARRAIAQVVDVIVVPLVALLIAVIFGFYEHAEDYVGMRPYLSGIAAGALAYLLINGWLMRNGQTLGKRLLKIVVCDQTGKPAGFASMFGRGLFFPLLYLTVFPPLTILPVLDVAFGFRRDGRCLHDLICRTEVKCAS